VINNEIKYAGGVTELVVFAITLICKAWIYLALSCAWVYTVRDKRIQYLVFQVNRDVSSNYLLNNKEHVSGKSLDPGVWSH